MPVETTLYSLSSQPPLPVDADRRGGERHLTLFRVGTLSVDGRRELCLIKNISAGGAMLRLYTSGMKVGQVMTVEPKCGQALSGKVAWVSEPNLGLAFDAPIDVIAMLSQSEDGPRPRMPRIETNAFVTVRQDGQILRGKACDISQGGIKIDIAAPLARNAEVVVTLFGLAPQKGVVRWIDGQFAGITFNRLLPLPELIEWLRGRGSSRAA